MGSQYYHDHTPYRSRSPYRGHSPSTPSQRQYSPPQPPMPRHNYSPLRRARSRSPQRNFSPQNDTRFSDRSRHVRTPSWQSQSFDRITSPRRQEYPERDRYNESSPRMNSRQRYDYPNSREETYYTQPQYSSSHGQSSPAFRPERTPPAVIDLEAWSPRYPTPLRNQNSSPYYPRNPLREHENDRRRNESLRGSREAPICVEEFQESPNWKRNRRDKRRRNIRESGAERLIHDEWRAPLPARDRSPRRSWGQRATPVRIDIPDSPPQVRRISNDVRTEVRREEAASLGQHWVHPDRREPLIVDQPAPAPPAPPLHPVEQNYNTEVDPTITHLQKPPPVTEQLPIRELAQSPDDRRQSSLERSLQERAVAERDMQLRLKQTEEEELRAEKALAQATIDADLAEKNARERQSVVQMLEARQLQVSTYHVPSRSAQSHSIASPQLRQDWLIPKRETSSQKTFDMQQLPTTEDPISSIVPAPITGDQSHKGLLSPEQRAQFNEDIRRAKKSKSIKAKKAQQRARGAEIHSHRGTTSASLTALTTGEKDQLLNQMAKYGAEILFAPKGQSTVPPQAASSFGHPPGLRLIQTPSETAVSQQIAPSMSASKQRNTDNTIVPQNQGASGVLRPILTITAEKAVSQVTNELSLLPDTPQHSKFDNPLRKRRLSFASSNGSNNSRLSNSPFLSSLLTSGTCVVCVEKDIPPLNRLARCAECSSLYHQSCHSPALTKAILEEAGGNWVCRICKQKQESVDVGKMSLTTRRGSSGLSVTLKRANYDEKALEETVMTNKSSFSSLLQKHAAWKVPTGPQSTAVKTTGADAAVEKASTTIASLSADVDGLSATESQLSETVAAKDVGVHDASSLDPKTTSKASTSVTPPISVKSISKSPPPTVRDPALGEVTFQEVSLGEAVPSAKPSDKTIPASQPSDSGQHSPDVMIPEPGSPPVIRPRSRVHRKADLVISDSEEEIPSKRAKTVASPRAAMKSASGTRPPLSKPSPLKLPLMSRSFDKTSRLARKSAPVARKSGIKFRKSQTPESLATKEKEMNKEELRSPISPVQSVRQFLRQPSPVLATRPTDPGASQHYSLQLILSKGASKNNPGLVIDSGSPGFDYSTPYPISLNRAVQPTRAKPASPLRKRSREKNNFDILSLVPDDAVPVIEDGKLAFREGAIDGRTGQLKRGARKFKVGRIIPGELL